MKSIRKFISRDVARHVCTFMVAAMLVMPACSDYLDIVPDNTMTLEDIFSVKNEAYNALAKLYYYMPRDPHFNSTTYYLGDEIVPALDLMGGPYTLYQKIMLGQNSATSPIMGYWSGYWTGAVGNSDGTYSMYRAINSAHIFIANIDRVQDMDEAEKADWKAQAQFLLGYYSFLLMQQSGPIVLKEHETESTAMGEELFPHRAKIEDCFDFILRYMDAAIPNLVEQRPVTDYGQIDRVGAAAIKARVLVYRASPFYNGNSEFYSGFLNHENEHFFPQTYDKEKWKAAIDAIEVAIDLEKQNGKDLYHSTKPPYSYDRDDFVKHPIRMQTLYDLSLLFPDPWNEELLWGNTKEITIVWDYALTTGVQIQLPGTGDGQGNIGGAYSWLFAPYGMLERFYTKNGLPIDEDTTFNRTTMHDVVITPGSTDPAYDDFRGYLQPGAETLKMYMHREPRFYADMGITGGYWRSHNTRVETMFYLGTPGASTHNTRRFWTGIGIQKLVHPEATAGNYQRMIRTPLPVIRVADLYLMQSEAWNEYVGPSAPEVYAAINLVRRRAGIPDVETAWNSTNARTRGKHTTQEGMREIILQERGIELAFEGLRFWDMHRYKRAHTEFTKDVMGWNMTGTDKDSFFGLPPAPTSKQSRMFGLRDYMWPIPVNELNKNSNLIQNPGW